MSQKGEQDFLRASLGLKPLLCTALCVPTLSTSQAYPGTRSCLPSPFFFSLMEFIRSADSTFIAVLSPACPESGMLDVPSFAQSGPLSSRSGPRSPCFFFLASSHFYCPPSLYVGPSPCCVSTSFLSVLSVR
eukprot:RCo037227